MNPTQSALKIFSIGPRFLLLALLCLGTASLAEEMITGSLLRNDPAANRLELQTPYGSMTVLIGKSTAILRDGAPLALGNLKPGQSLDVMGIELQGGVFAATRILASSSEYRGETNPVPFPKPNSTTEETRPLIGAGFPFVPSKIRFWLDGVEYLERSLIRRGQSVEFKPESDLKPGKHSIKIWAVNIEGLVESSEWKFRVARPVVASTARDGIWVSPQANSTTTSSWPVIMAKFPEQIVSGSVLVDGASQNKTSISGGLLKVQLERSLARGGHYVVAWARGQSGKVYSKSWPFEISDVPAEALIPLSVKIQSPGSNSIVQQQRPSVGARFSKSIKKSSLRLFVDGKNFTDQSVKKSKSITWSPDYDLDYGEHIVRVEAATSRGEKLEKSWTFVLQPAIR